MRKRRKKLMDAKEFAKRFAKLGGKARAKSLTPEKRREIAIKASEAAKLARQRKAEEKVKARKDGGGRGK